MKLACLEQSWRQAAPLSTWTPMWFWELRGAPLPATLRALVSPTALLIFCPAALFAVLKDKQLRAYCLCSSTLPYKHRRSVTAGMQLPGLHASESSGS